MGTLLESIHSPADLKRLTFAQMAELAGEIREFLVQTLSKTGGHLGPNLGVVELTLALHAVFNTPEDKLLFDVSHQAYIHKILTGRLDRLDTIRQPADSTASCSALRASTIVTEPATQALPCRPHWEWPSPATSPAARST